MQKGLQISKDGFKCLLADGVTLFVLIQGEFHKAGKAEFAEVMCYCGRTELQLAGNFRRGEAFVGKIVEDFQAGWVGKCFE